MHTIVEAVLLFLPAGISNMTPILANKVPGLNRWDTPMDFGKSWGHARIFGDHKRWRGLVTGVICGTLTGLLLYTGPLHDKGTSYIACAAAISLGALLGDAIKSFFKRRVGVKSGGTWFPFDQIDYIIGGLLFGLPFGQITVPLTLLIAVLYFGLHLISTYVGYLLGLKDSPI